MGARLCSRTWRRGFPGLIHCRISGFGGDGPLGGLPGYDAILQAMTGLMSVNGDATTGPMRLGTAIVDMGTGLYSAIGILMALHERARSGRGPVSRHDAVRLRHGAAASAGGELFPQRQAADAAPATRIRTWCRTTSIPTRTCEIFIASGNNGQFRKLCEIIGRPEMADDPRFASNAERNVNRDALTEQLARGVRRAGRRRTGAAADPRRRAGGAGAAGRPGRPPRRTPRIAKWSPNWAGTAASARRSSCRRTPGGTRAAPPTFGEHGAEVLAQHGYTPEEIAELPASGVVLRERRRT